MTHRTAIVVSLALSTLAPTLAAQCPDGSPPASCRATPRHDPPLDDRTWLVLPFQNTGGDTANDLVHNASVSLLYQDMSRWRDVRVIPDARVADLLRHVPAAEQLHLGLTMASDLARRAGAGRVVLGNYLFVRGRATLSATVFVVRSGEQLRVVSEPITGLESPNALDSLDASFGRLSRRILALPPSAKGSAGGAGTTSIEAYRAYGLGMAAINHFAVDSGLAALDRAIAYDSTFALAHLRRSQFTFDSAIARPHLLAAIRLADGLPPRERTLLEGYAALDRRDYPQLCSAANRLVADDSTSADSWVMTARCNNDARLIVDGSNLRWGGDPTLALRAAERAYALDPQSFEAFFAWVFNVAFHAAVARSGNPDNPYRMVCAVEVNNLVRCPLEQLYRVTSLLVGDSIGVTIQPWADARHAPADMRPEAVASWQQSARRGREALHRFRQSAPDSWFLSWIEAQLALEVGDTAAAGGAFGRGQVIAFDTSGLNRARAHSTALNVSLARGRMLEANAYADSLLANRSGPAEYFTLFGRLGERADTSENGRQNMAWRQVLVGVLPAGFDTLEGRIAARLSGPIRDDFLQLSTLAAFHMRRSGPALDTAAVHPLKRAQAWIGRHDATRARAALAEFDRELTARHVATPDDGGWLFSAETHLELGDSAVALERMAEFAHRWVYEVSCSSSNILEQWYFLRATPRLWGRAWMLFGDLAMARNQPADARRAYKMVVGLWEKGDPPVQPMVTRAKAALAELGN